MATLVSISRDAVRRRAARFLAVWALMMALGVATFGVAVSTRLPAPPLREEISLLLFVLGSMNLLMGPALLFVKKERFPSPRHVSLGLVRVPIAAVPRDASTVVAVEGRVARAASASELTAPLSGSPCSYYRVRVDRWGGLEPGLGPYRADRWWGLHERWRVEPFVVADESGFVLIQPVELADPDEQSRVLDPVDVDLEISSRVTRYDSPSGIQGLPPAVRAYVEANERSGRATADGQRIRVTEIVLREGDHVSVIGAMEERTVQVGSFRDDGGERIPVMVGFPRELHVIPAHLEELRWLVTFHRRLTIAFIAGTLMGLAALGLGVLSIAAR